MSFLSQSLGRLSMLSAAALGATVVAAPASAGEAPGLYYGRWTVSEDRPVFTARGRAYKTIDVARCGNDFCGVSVDDKGKCGAVLFRFLNKHAATEQLRGHARWGGEQKNIEIYSYGSSVDNDAPAFELYLGDGYNFGGRSPNMPKFHAEYRKTGAARCVAR